MNLNFRRNRRIPATAPAPTRHNGASVPQSPTPTGPTPTEVYVGGYGYRLDWPNHLRARAAAKRKEAESINEQVQEGIARSARCCDEADELERIAAIVELDQRSAFAPEPEPGTFPAAALANGWQLDDERDTLTMVAVDAAGGVR